MMAAATVVQLIPQSKAAVRYQLRLPVIFSWNDAGPQTEGGFTKEIARDGALILSSRCPPVGTQVRIEVLLPALVEGGSEIRIECAGKVTRQAGFGCFEVRGLFDDGKLSGQARS